MVWYWHKIDVWTYGIEFKSPETGPYISGQFNVDKDVIYLMRKEQYFQLLETYPYTKGYSWIPTSPVYKI